MNSEDKKSTKCPKCNRTFNIHENRSHKIKDSIIPGAWFVDAMNQFENFNQVTCPYCQYNYVADEARLFGIFKSPYTVVIVGLFFVGAVIGISALLKAL